VIVALATPAQHVYAQNSRNLSMDDAISLGVQNSKQLKLSKAKIDEATANHKDAWNNHLPDVKVSGSLLYINNPNIDVKLNTGGSGTSTTTATAFPKVNEAAYGFANATMPLFAGLRVKYGVESAKYLEQAAKMDADNDKEAVIQNTIDAYSNLYKASKSVELVKQNLKQQAQRVTDFTNLESNGLIARNDLLKAQLQESNIELSLLDAENNLKVTYENMDLMLGLPEGTELIPDSTGFQNPGDAGAIANWEQTALQSRKDVAALSYRQQAANSSIKAAKGDYYPSIALTGGYVELYLQNLATISNALNVGVGLQYNLGSLWKTGAKVEVARARLHEIEANQEMLSDEIRLQITKAYENYLLSLRKIEVYNKAIDQANENYRITKNKYDNSLVNTTDLLDADVAQLQAQLNYAFSKADALVAYKKLQQTAGVLSNSYTSTK
jgi:outer membrane protein TolC